MHSMSSLGQILDQLTVEGELSEAAEAGAVRCFACGHRCLIRDGKRGICQVRFNAGGKLHVPWGYVAALQSDPIEKKPFFHVLPGSTALTFGMLGCDYHCGYCQNWLTSQAMRDPDSDISAKFIRHITPDQLVEHATRTALSCRVIYNEPIASEWAIAIFQEGARDAGLMWRMSPTATTRRRSSNTCDRTLSAYKVDLKCMQDKSYRSLGGVLQNTFRNPARADAGMWVEIVTLHDSGFNDSNEELWVAARFIAGVSRDIPWHVTAFHKDYKMTEPANTDAATLLRAAEIGREAGLRYVYAGNLPGRTGEYEDTFCGSCNARLVERTGYSVSAYRIAPEGTCPKCSARVPGLWPANPRSVVLNGLGIPLPLT
jgi:pyruvate formate lyase activating enzyme